MTQAEAVWQVLSATIGVPVPVAKLDDACSVGGRRPNSYAALSIARQRARAGGMQVRAICRLPARKYPKTHYVLELLPDNYVI